MSEISYRKPHSGTGELDTGVSSVIDHRVDEEASELTVRTQKSVAVLMEKFSLPSGQKISEREISRIGQKL